ncbi:MAG: M64 family metallopeptidase [Planctomycetota bacterium]
MPIRSDRVAGVACSLITCAGAAAGGPGAATIGPGLSGPADAPGVLGDGPAVERVHGCWPGEDGNLTGIVKYLPYQPEAFPAQANSRRMMGLDNRVDLVLVGDGYTAGDMGVWAQHASNVENQFFRDEPFTAYEPYFRVTRVDVISNESGVDNDPSVGVSRDTALDMQYWCGGTERLLCVNTTKAHNAALGGADDVDQILAIANSSKYGGAGYTSSNVGTLAGANGSAVEIAIHEMGHSLGDLADEYTYGGPAAFPGGEPSRANVSILNETEQLAQQRKWWRWMGDVDGRFDGPVGTYEGGQYSVTGVYRPSNNSMMRNLFRRFNAPGAESLIREIYREVSPIDDATPTGATIMPGETISVTPMRPIGHELAITWAIDGVTDFSLSGLEAIAPEDLTTAPGTRELTVTVVDPTDMVRDESMRQLFMTETRTWTIEVPCPGGVDVAAPFGELDFFDVLGYLALFDAGDPEADRTCEGTLDFFDVLDALAAFDMGCEA